MLRDGEIKNISAEDIVIGDILILRSGDNVTADSRILDAGNVEVDESSLTGESQPVKKQAEKLEKE